METGLQQINLLNAVDELLPNDLTTELPGMDPGQLTFVYPVDPAWINPSQLIGRVNTQSSTGGLTVEDIDMNTIFNPVDQVVVNAEGSRYYTSIHVSLAGGQTNPVTITLALAVGASGMGVHVVNVANPGRVTFTSVLCGPRIVARIVASGGGAADTMQVQFCGWQQAPGVPCMMVPPTNISLFP